MQDTLKHLKAASVGGVHLGGGIVAPLQPWVEETHSPHIPTLMDGSVVLSQHLSVIYYLINQFGRNMLADTYFGRWLENV